MSAAALLAQLLAERVPRREQCQSCRHWERDDDDPEYGDCPIAWDARLSGTHAREGCVYYEPMERQWYDD